MAVLPRSLCGRICCCCCSSILFSIITTLLSLWLLILSPIITTEGYERYVRDEIELFNNQSTRSNSQLQQRAASLPKHITSPLIRNVTQLFTTTANEQLGLHGNLLDFLDITSGYAKFWQGETWIYIGGTNPGSRPWYYDILPLTPSNGSCADPAAMCNAFNEGFDRVMDESNRTAIKKERGLDFAFVDCDVSPMICDVWQLNPVMLLHMKAKMPFDMNRHGFICSVEWTYVGLPLTMLPYNRNVRIAGHLVPAFPSEYEQMRSLVAYDGAVAGLHEDESVTKVDYSTDEVEFPQEKVELGIKDGLLSETIERWARDVAKHYLETRKSMLSVLGL